MKRPDMHTRFLSKVEISGLSCWEWKASKIHSGYGQFKIRHNKMVGAHRTSWEMFNSPIPHGLYVLHKCDNRSCVNPMHLFLGTAKDNMQDKMNKGRCVSPGFKGEKHYDAKLTDKIVISCRKRRISGELISELAKEYNVTFAAMRNAIVGITWRHI